MESIRIEDVIVGERVRQDMGDLAGLAASINALGLLQPIGITPERRLIFGERRLRAVSEILGWESVPCVVIDNLTTALRLLQAEDQENREREGLNVVEKVELARRLTAILKPEAAARKAEAQAGNRERDDAGRVKPAGGAVSDTTGETREKPRKPPKKQKTRDEIAKAVGMGRTTLAQATEVVQAAKADPSLAPVVEEMNRTGNVAAAHRVVNPPEPIPDRDTEEFCRDLEVWRDAFYRSSPGRFFDLSPIGSLIDKLIRFIRTGRKSGPAVTVEDCTIPQPLDTPEVRDALHRWLVYRRTVRKPAYKTAKAVDDELKDWESKGPNRFIEAVENSIKRQYQGLFDGQRNGKPERFGPGQNYDPDAAAKDPDHGKW